MSVGAIKIAIDVRYRLLSSVCGCYYMMKGFHMAFTLAQWVTMTLTLTALTGIININERGVDMTPQTF